MEFRNDAQRELHERVAGWMKELFGEVARARTDAPGFMIAAGSVAVYVAVMPWREEEAVVVARAFVVEDVDVTPGLAIYLLERNNELQFGAFGLDGQGGVCFDYSMLGSTCDKSALKTIIQVVASTADKYDDSIVSRWGGKRALEG